MAPELAFDIALHDPAAAVITVTGELDLEGVMPLAQALRVLLGQGRIHLVLDTAALGFCDSTGLNLMISTHHRAQALNGSLILAAVPDSLSRLLALTGVDTVIPQYPTALQALTRQP